MGGVETDEWGRTALEGLYAAGEVACVSVHGANRLGGNSLMEERSPSAAAGAPRRRVRARRRHRRRERERGGGSGRRRDVGRGLLDVDSGERPWQIRDEAAARRCSRTSASSGTRPHGGEIGIIGDLRRRYARGIVVEDKGTIFNNDLTAAISSATLLTSPRACCRQGSPGRSRGARPTRGRPTSPSATTRIHEALDQRMGRRRTAALVSRRPRHEVGATRADY